MTLLITLLAFCKPYTPTLTLIVNPQPYKSSARHLVERTNWAVGGEGVKAGAFRDFWEAGAPLVGDEGATGWATWESKHGIGLHSPAPNGTPAGGTAATPRREEEEKGGWGEWVPLMPDTPMEPQAASEPEAEAEAAADEVRQAAVPYHMAILDLWMLMSSSSASSD